MCRMKKLRATRLTAVQGVAAQVAEMLKSCQHRDMRSSPAPTAGFHGAAE